jgi:hypothetical protein
MTSTTRTRILATGIAGALALAPAAGARPSPEELQGPAVKGAAQQPWTGRTSYQPAVAATDPVPATPVVVRSTGDSVDLGSAALGAGGAALVLLASGAGVASARRARVPHGLS